MKFIKKAEKFFLQLQHTLCIDALQIIASKKGMFPVQFDSSDVFEQVKKFNLEFPFQTEARIAELRHLMLKDGLEPEAAVSICANFKDEYWIGDYVLPTTSQGIMNAHANAVKALNPSCSKNEIMQAYLAYGHYQVSKRNGIYERLINELTKTSAPKIQTTLSASKTSELKNNSSVQYQLFAQGGYELFLYLVENYTRDNKQKVKFSNLFHFLDHEGFILGTQLNYISFIKEEYKITLSKITPPTLKYSEKIQPSLSRLSSDFKRISKN